MSGARTNLSTTLIVFVFGMLLTVAAVLLASSKLLREPAVRLMSPKVPGAKKKRGGGGRLSLYSRLILMNMRTDLNRVLVTVVSVAGCCALVVIGISMRASLMGSTERQYEDIVQYDMNVLYNPDVSEDAGEKIENALGAVGADYTVVFTVVVNYVALRKVKYLKLTDIA